MKFFSYPPAQPWESLEETIASAVSQTTESLKDVLKEDGSVQGTLSETPDKPKAATSTESAAATAETSEEPTDPELDEYGLTKAQQIEARQFFASLRDPDKAAKVVDFLATNNGYAKPETKKEAVTQAKSIVEDMKESLGPELEYLADKMGPVIEKHLKTLVEENTAPLKTQITEREQERLKDQASVATDSLATEYFGSLDKMPDNLLAQMNKVMDDIQPKAGQPMKEFLKRVMFVAAAELDMPLTKPTKTSTTTPNKDKVDKNRNDAASRLASERQAPRVGEKALAPGKQMSLQDAVQLATSQAAELMEKRN